MGCLQVHGDNPPEAVVIGISDVIRKWWMVDGKGDVARGWPLGITCFFFGMWWRLRQLQAIDKRKISASGSCDVYLKHRPET
jgi:hypothetical protein